MAIVQALLAAVLATSIAVAPGSVTLANAETPARFEDYVLSLKGRWSGKGTVQMTDGSRVAAKCVATYFVKADGTEVKQNLRCKNDRFELNFSGHGFVDGNAISGTWTENKYNVKGTFGGNYDGGIMMLQAESRQTGAIITVKSDGCTQDVEISPTEADKLGVITILGVMRKC